MSKELTNLFVPEAGKEPSLNQLAIVLGIPAARLQSNAVAYKPKVGEAYEGNKKVNWESVSEFIARRIEKTGYETVEQVYEAALATEYVPKKATHTKDPNSVYGKVLFGTTPLRKGNVTVGTYITSKKTGEQFEVVYVNDTIVVFEPINGEFKVSQAIGNRMFNMNYNIVENKAE